jgi:DNA modification methylase
MQGTVENVIDGRAQWCVVQGDALAVLASLPQGSVDAVVCDPPYGMAYQSAWSKDGPRFAEIVGDDTPSVGFVRDAVRSLKPGGGLFLFCEWRHQEAFRGAMADAGATIRSQCVWDREHHGMGDLVSAFAPCHDIGWFATKGDGFKFHGSRPQTVLRFPRVAAAGMVHPAQKPTSLMRYLVSRLCPIGGVVLDPFAGSGSTLVAAVTEGRRCIGVEITEGYAKLAADRVAAACAGTDYRNPQQGGLFASGGI